MQVKAKAKAKATQIDPDKDEKLAKADWGHMGVSENSRTQQPWIFLLKMIILGCFGGTPIFGNTHIASTFANLFPQW